MTRDHYPAKENSPNLKIARLKAVLEFCIKLPTWKGFFPNSGEAPVKLTPANPKRSDLCVVNFSPETRSCQSKGLVSRRSLTERGMNCPNGFHTKDFTKHSWLTFWAVVFSKAVAHQSGLLHTRSRAATDSLHWCLTGWPSGFRVEASPDTS